MSRQFVYEHYKKFFNLSSNQIDEDDEHEIDWGQALIEDYEKRNNPVSDYSTLLNSLREVAKTNKYISIPNYIKQYAKTSVEIDKMRILFENMLHAVGFNKEFSSQRTSEVIIPRKELKYLPLYKGQYISHLLWLDEDFIGLKKTQDHEGEWYWIPKNELGNFQESVNKICGIEYLDNPDAFDDFTNSFGKYATGGDVDNRPSIFEGVDVEFI